LTKALGHTVSEIKHHDVESSAIFAIESIVTDPRVCTKQAFKTFEEVEELDIIKIIHRYHFETQQLIACRSSLYQLLGQHEGDRYS
jgi:hypothetical protein